MSGSRRTSRAAHGDLADHARLVVAGDQAGEVELAMKMLTRRGVLVEEMGQTYLAEPDADSEEAQTPRPLQAAAVTYRIAFGPRAGQKVLTLQGVMPREGMARQPLCADIDGFSLPAAVRVEAHDRKRLEQLCRYFTRPALSDERVQVNAAGQVELKLKTPWRDGTTHLVMSPLEFMQRLAALAIEERPAVAHAAAEVAPDQVPWRAGSECQAACSGGAAGASRARAAGSRRRRPRVRCRGRPFTAWPHPAIHGLAASPGQGCSSACSTSTCIAAPTAVTEISRSSRPFCEVSPDANGPEDRLRLANARASVPWRPVIEKILTHLGLDPQPPPRGRAREVGQDFAT